jgi:transposase InsO family protein
MSMDGRGRVFDHSVIERLWRTVKYAQVSLNDSAGVPAVVQGLRDDFRFYNHARLHQARNDQTPAGVYHQRASYAANPRQQSLSLRQLSRIDHRIAARVLASSPRASG